LRTRSNRSAALALGYYQLGGEPPNGELMDMFIEPAVIGTGLGRMLWEHTVRSASERVFHSLTLESDPHAEPFYLRMGPHALASGRSPRPACCH
jgi:GNAT superfamily N-acetyltransferase